MTSSGIRRALLAALLLASSASRASAQFDYHVTMDVEAKTWRVTGEFPTNGADSVDFWIARWTPGAYHTADYGRFIEGLKAHGDTEDPLEVERVSDSHFRIACKGHERIALSYDALAISDGLIADGMVLDVESNRITDEYGYITPVSLFGFVPGRLDEPYTLQLALPDGWEAATILEADEAGTLQCESYYRFEDSPIFLSPSHRTAHVTAAGVPLDVTVYGPTGEAFDEVVEGCVKIAESAAALMGGLPYDRYEFLIGFVPESQGGSGLEHSYSTLILANERQPASSIWGLVAHEFFHLWCAERIHVQEIREPVFHEPFTTGTIWVNESMTEYMTQHVLLHAGLLDRDGFLQAVGPNPMIDQMAASLGAPTEISARDWEDMEDLMTFAMKMYMQGPRIILALDMQMRAASNGRRGIVDLLRYVIDEYDEKGKGFPEDGMLDIVNEVAGGDLDPFFERFIDGAENPDLAEFVGVIGCEVKDGRIVPLEEMSESQRFAFDDFFSIPPADEAPVE